MKLNNTIIFQGIMVLVWSIFMGVTAISIGVGAAFPPLNIIAKPFVCPNGQMIYNTDTFSTAPGTTYTEIGWYCVDSRSETKQTLDIFPMVLYSGFFYGLLVFAAALVIWYRGTLSKPAKSFPKPMPAYRAENYSYESERSGSSVERMNELKALRDSNSITEAEYQKKRAEILKDL